MHLGLKIKPETLSSTLEGFRVGLETFLCLTDATNHHERKIEADYFWKNQFSWSPIYSTVLTSVHHISTGKISYKIDKDQLVVSKLFTLLNSVKIQLGISDWGVKRTSLEDGNWALVTITSHDLIHPTVFLNIVTKHDDRRMEPRNYGACSNWLPCQHCYSVRY